MKRLEPFRRNLIKNIIILIIFNLSASHHLYAQDDLFFEGVENEIDIDMGHWPAENPNSYLVNNYTKRLKRLDRTDEDTLKKRIEEIKKKLEERDRNF